MLSVYTRHSQECDHRDDINWRRCRCPKWIQGVTVDGGPLRVTAKTRSWEQAEARARQVESAADPNKPQVKPAITIVEAVSSFRADEDGRCLEKTTVAQSRSLFEVQLLTWAKERSLILLTELTTPELTKFRASWGNGPNTTKRKHERLVGFFNFCIANDWLEKNPAARMKRVEEKRVPTDHFTREEFERVVDATYGYGDWQGWKRAMRNACCASRNRWPATNC
jgi:hypothetical protein